jgi:hypothetical protein
MPSRTQSTRLRAGFEVVLAIALLAPALHADDKAQAEALFVEARQLLQQNKVAEATTKLETSYKLDPAVGTLLNLAHCYELLGKTATAWATYTQAAGMATPDRAVFAQQKAAALLPTLSKLMIQAPSAPPSLRVTRDGAVVSPATYGVAIPVDPGHHVIDATAQGRSPFHREVDVGANAASVTVIIP